MPTDLLRLSGTVELLAAAGDGKVPTCRVTAFTGGLMRLPGWGAVALDLTGIECGRVALLVDHDATLQGIIGHGVAAVRGGQLLVEGELPQVTDAAKRVVELAKSGFAWQASVGVQPTETERVPPGGSIKLNGQTLTADASGLHIVRAGVLKEVSFVALAADAGTSVAVAASQKGTSRMSTPSFQEFLAANGVESEAVGPVDMVLALRASYEALHPEAAETRAERVLAIAEREGFHPDVLASDRAKALRAAALAGRITAAGYQAGLLQIEKNFAEVRAIRAERPTAPGVYGSRLDGGDVKTLLAAGLMLKAGFSAAAERQFGAPVLHAADRARKMHLLDLREHCLRADGREKPGSRDELVKAAFSTVILPQALGLAGEKVLLDAYQQSPAA